MNKHNEKNERIKRQYFAYLREAKRQSEASVDAVAAALARFEAHTRHRNFQTFHHQQAVAFKLHLAGRNGGEGERTLSKATQYATLSHLKRFFQWLAGQPGYKSRLRYSDAEYFNLPEKESRVATARRERPSPTLEQVRYVISQMPGETDIEMRNRAVIAFVMLTGARDSAVASLKLKHINLGGRSVHQDARDVRTKFSKTFTTFFFPVGDDIETIISDWIVHLRTLRLWGPEDALFPRTKVAVNAIGQFAPVGLERGHWSNATPIREIFRNAFQAAGLPYFVPHSLRHTLAQLGEQICRTPEEFKAWSQNLGHEGVLTTFYSYGSVATRRQGEIIRNLGMSPDRAPEVTAEMVAAMMNEMLKERVRQKF